MINPNQFKKSISYALTGLSVTFAREQNFRIHTIMAMSVVLLAFLLQCSRIEWIFLSIIIFSVLVGELINSATERLIDLVKPRLSEQAKFVKDCMAAAILLLSINAVITGALIFIPKIIKLINNIG